MDSILGNYEDGKNNFWKMNPTFKVPLVFKEFYAMDKSKGKKKSSDIMWALCFFFDKSPENPYRNLQKQDRIEVINEDVLADPDFSWETEENQIIYKEGEKTFFTVLERMYYGYLDKMDERLALIEKSSYTLETASALDKIIKDTESVRKEMDTLKRLVEQQEVEGRTKGDIILSASEKGEI